jgi:hypothetical protein
LQIRRLIRATTLQRHHMIQFKRRVRPRPCPVQIAEDAAGSAPSLLHEVDLPAHRQQRVAAEAFRIPQHPVTDPQSKARLGLL